MEIDILPVGPLQTNAYLATCTTTREAILIDPGWNAQSLKDAIEQRKATVKLIVNTHAHWDHIGGNAAMMDYTNAPLAIHKDEIPLLRNKGGADIWNIPLRPSPEPDHFLIPGESLTIGRLTFKILFTPGHTPGHISLYEAEQKALFDGDVLFNQGIGRTDLPGGSTQDIMDTLQNVLMKLPNDVTVYPGHGGTTTIGDERQMNPWLR